MRLEHTGGITMAAMLRVRAYFLVLVLLLTTISVASAADQTITLKLGAQTALGLERAFKTVLIGDPNIVDVHTLSDRRVTLEPLNLGATNLIFVDERSIAITNVRIVISTMRSAPLKQIITKPFF
jgi:Flp pilus assembly secretin CpaC